MGRKENKLPDLAGEDSDTTVNTQTTAIQDDARVQILSVSEARAFSAVHRNTHGCLDSNQVASFDYRCVWVWVSQRHGYKITATETSG